MTEQEDFCLKIVKDYPQPGVNFIDINGLLAEPQSYRKAINAFVEQIKKQGGCQRTAILAPESRGFLFASAVAYQSGLPLVAVRKKGKVPNKPYRFQIQNEYDSYEMEIDSDILEQFENYIYIDDIFATGQTLTCIAQALSHKGKKICLALHLTAVEGLKEIRQENSVLQSIPHKEII